MLVFCQRCMDKQRAGDKSQTWFAVLKFVVRKTGNNAVIRVIALVKPVVSALPTSPVRSGSVLSERSKVSVAIE